MSSILKALEKVERERARRDGLSPALSSAGKRRSPWALPAGIAIGAAIAALGTFAAMGGFSHRPAAPVVAKPSPAVVAKAPEVKASAPAALPPSVPAAPVTPVAPAAPEKLPTVDFKEAPVVVAEKPSEPSPVKRKKSTRQETHSHAARKVAAARSEKPVAVPVAVQPAPAAFVAPAPSPQVVAAPAAAPASAPVTASAPGADLKVTGIALQGNGDTSFAIVNGRPVAKGGSVDGAKVEDILADRVRFSSGGKRFDVKVEEIKQ